MGHRAANRAGRSCHSSLSDPTACNHGADCGLSQPVKFAQSGGTADDGKVDVSIIFVLALKDPKEQLSLLQKLMAAISNEEMLASLMGTSAPLEFSNIFNGASAE